ncbi:MAG TPA: matrixin family metalloprotease [Gemmatimonadaceae bacterium]|nr:matrixin family metalloprotease [Gemmatimonadaceae bacterium]
MTRPAVPAGRRTPVLLLLLCSGAVVAASAGSPALHDLVLRHAGRFASHFAGHTATTTVTANAGSVVRDPARAESDPVRSAATPRPARRNLDEIRRRLREGEPGTYIRELLLDHDSSLARWPERMHEPLRVWIQPARPDLEDWSPNFVKRVRGAFNDWENTGIPVFFDFVADSAAAEVHVVWTDHFDEPISGKTLWARDDRWWIVDGNITIAVHHNGGEPLDESAVKAIALHEVGHLIGLDHTTDSANIMTAKVRVRDLSPADRATVRLLYTLPPGTVR